MAVADPQNKHKRPVLRVQIRELHGDGDSGKTAVTAVMETNVTVIPRGDKVNGNTVGMGIETAVIPWVWGQKNIFLRNV